MAWELLAIWAIIAVVVTWFVRDEKRRTADAEIARAARYYAHADRFRHVSAGTVADPIPVLVRRPGGLTAEQRAFIAAYSSSRARQAFQD